MSNDVLRPTERFSDRVESYARYRPGYPLQILDCLRRNCGLTADWMVTDIGSGTGLLAKVFLENGNRVFGVEPNRAMRAAGEQFLLGYHKFSSMEGTAEATGLERHSVDLIAAGQAFHWFDRGRARQEFERILKPGGWVALVWNERLTSTPFLADYEQLLHRYSCDYSKVDHRNVGQAVLAEFFRPGRFHQATFNNCQQFDWQGLYGRWLSSSYVPAQGRPGHEEMLGELREIYRRHARGDSVDWQYETKLYYGRFGG